MNSTIPVKLPDISTALNLGILSKLELVCKVDHESYIVFAQEYVTMQRESDKVLANFVRLVREGSKPRSLGSMRQNYSEALDKLNKRVNEALEKSMK